MLLKKQLLSQDNLNNAFISKTNAAEQSISGDLRVIGGRLMLSNTVLTDDANSNYFRIDPQGNRVVIYDGVNNQQVQIFSSSGNEYLYLTTINQANNASYGLIDIFGNTTVSHLEITTNSKKPLKIGGRVEILNGNDVILKAGATSVNDAGDIVFQNNDGTQKARIWTSQTGPNTGLHLTARSDNVAQLTFDTNAIWSAVDIRIAGGYSLLFSDFGGGFGMYDNSWIRTLGSKNFYHNAGIMRTDGTLQVGDNGSTFSVANFGNLNFKSGVLFGDAFNNRVGINTTAPTQALDVAGNVRVTGTLLTPTHDGNRAIQGSTTNYSYSVQSHAKATWNRNEIGRWVFQSGVGGDNWTETMDIHLPTNPSGALNSIWAEIGQRTTNDNGGGRNRGVRITKVVSGPSLIDGDLRAGNIYATAALVLPVGANRYATVGA